MLKNNSEANLTSTSHRLHDKLSSNVLICMQRKDETRDGTNLWYNTNSLSQTAHVNVPNVLTVDENTP